MTFYNMFSAVRSTAEALASFYITLGHILRLFQPLPSAVLIGCLLLNLQGVTVYFALFLMILCVVKAVAQVISFRRDHIHLWHENIAHPSPPSHRFASGHIFISRESPRPLKPDKSYSRLVACYPASGGPYLALNNPLLLVSCYPDSGGAYIASNNSLSIASYCPASGDMFTASDRIQHS